MLEWLTVMVGVVGFAIILAIPTWLWCMVIYGLAQIAREKRGEGGPYLPKWDQMEDRSLPRTEPRVTWTNWGATTHMQVSPWGYTQLLLR